MVPNGRNDDNKLEGLEELEFVEAELGRFGGLAGRWRSKLDTMMEVHGIFQSNKVWFAPLVPNGRLYNKILEILAELEFVALDLGWFGGLWRLWNQHWVAWWHGD